MSLTVIAILAANTLSQFPSLKPSPEESMNVLIGVSTSSDHVDMASVFTGVKLRELAKGLFDGAWDVKAVGSTGVVAIASTDGRILQVELSSGTRVRPDVQMPGSLVAPSDNRKITVFSESEIIVWVRRLAAGYLINLHTGALIRTFSSPGAQIDGLTRVGSRLFGVDIRGRIFTWTLDSDLPKSISAENGNGGGYMSQPIANGLYVYALSRPGTGNSGMWLHRFNPSNPVTKIAWDAGFAVSTPGWRFGNYLCSVGTNRLQFISLEYGGSGPYWGLGKFDVATRTFSAGGPSYAWDGITAVNLGRF